MSRSLSLEQDNWQHSQHYLSLMGTGKLLGIGGSHFAPNVCIQRLGLALTLLFLWSHSYSISCDHRNSWMIYQKYTYHPGFSHALKRPRGSKSTNQLARRRWKTRYQASTRSQEKPTNCLRWELSEMSLSFVMTCWYFFIFNFLSNEWHELRTLIITRATNSQKWTENSISSISKY